jgi:hypothetical protein
LFQYTSVPMHFPLVIIPSPLHIIYIKLVLLVSCTQISCTSTSTIFHKTGTQMHICCIWVPISISFFIIIINRTVNII